MRCVGENNDTQLIISHRRGEGPSQLFYAGYPEMNLIPALVGLLLVKKTLDSRLSGNDAHD